MYLEVNKLTFFPRRLLGFRSREAAVKAEVILAVNIAKTMRPNMIQIMEKMRATRDFGDLSPYLVNTLTTIQCLFNKYFELGSVRFLDFFNDGSPVGKGLSVVCRD